MYQKTLHLKSLLLAIAMLPVIAFAQYTSLSDKLTEVSNEMYNKGDANYILVDAVKDGVINFDEHYDFTYEKGHIRFNGKELAPDYRDKYENKMARMLVTSGKGIDTRMYYRGGGVRMKDIMNENSSFRKGPDDVLQKHDEIVKKHEEIVKKHQKIIEEHQKIIEEHQKIAARNKKTAAEMEEVTRKNVEMGRIQTAYTNKIIAAMAKDGLVSEKDPIHIQWNLKGIFINDKKITGTMAEKYNAMFERETGYKLEKPDDGVEITRNSSMSITKASD